MSGRQASRLTLLAALHVLLNLIQGSQSFTLEVGELLDRFSQHSLLEQVVHNLLMIFLRVEPRKRFHCIDYLSIFFRLLPLLLLNLLEVKQTSLDHELLASNALINTSVVELNDIVLKLNVLLCIVIEVFQISEESVCISIIFLIEVSSFWHVAHDLVEVWEIRGWVGLCLLLLFWFT